MISPEFTPQPVVEPGRVGQQGVYAPDFGAYPHKLFVGANAGMTTAAAHLVLVKALRAAREGVPDEARRGELDARHAPLVVGSREGALGYFLLDKPLLVDIRTAAKERILTHTDLGRLAIANTKNAVQPGFTTDAINAANESYFRSPVAFSPEAGLASIFAGGETTNLMLGMRMAYETGITDRPIRVKELGSGTRTNHWNWMAEGVDFAGTPGLDVTLTDFVPPPLPPEKHELLQGALRSRSEVYSLHDDLPELPAGERYDVIFGSYVFDSVWLEGDIRLNRVGEKFYQSFYRLKVDSWNPRQRELLSALRKGVALPNAKAEHYEGIFVEEVMREVTIDNHPWADVLRELPEAIATNIPVGTIRRAVQALDRQLTPDGVFMLADVTDTSYPEHSRPASGVSGVAERYKVENWAIARRVLEQYYGLEVHFDDLQDMAARMLSPDWEEYTKAKELGAIQENAIRVMTVRRRKPQEQDAAS